MDKTDSSILTLKEAAQRLRISERTLDRLCQTVGGPRKLQITARRVGFLEQDIDDYIERLAVAGQQKNAAPE